MHTNQSDSTLIINFDHVEEVGKQIIADAQKITGSERDGTQDFQNTLQQIKTMNFPSELIQTFDQFIIIHYQAYTGLLQDRQYIGEALQKNVVDPARVNEIQTIASFTPTQGGPVQETLPR